ncbi:hypothetical protein EYC98_13705 [Halieaceae bacterium IMCC14734]|uniref:Uncharacterized protein n=1 Tax=Candidatus Litorirhabdus singularis TaxID=2518993 RepID=A0ABT3THW8_9GAMM|nr:hypothetical protein [Candidatus Litorirhabdus singularis]MCX2981913.1 hypothetical protein [Candidatus Litorirhabdus singularis]
MAVVDPKVRAYTDLMDERYDIYYSAGILDDFEEEAVRANLARLFKAGDAALDKLFSGNPQPVKRGVDKAAALKYKTAMNRAGAIAIIRKNTPAPTTQTAPVATTVAAPVSNTAASAEPMSMADRVAALTKAGGTTAATMTLAPTGSEILNPEERISEQAPDLDLSRLSIAQAPDFDAEKRQAKAAKKESESDPEPKPLPEPVLESAPDTSHISMGEVGENIPLLAEAAAALSPDISHLSVGEVGETIPTLVSDVTSLRPDTSAIELAPEGSDVLENQYRKVESGKAPNTDHLQLEKAAAD